MADLDPGLTAVLVVAAFFLVWYYGAFVYTRRLARRIGTELKRAVVVLGGTSKIQWFGPGAFRMKTEGANPPFQEFSLTVTLRPREMPINWAIGTAQGRRDAALVEASLRKDPRIEFELVDPKTRIGRWRSRSKADWSKVSLGGGELLLSSDDERGARRILESIDPSTLDPIAALHVTAGKQPGIAASVSVAPGAAARGIEAIRALAERLTT
ncbi:MAG: hypothetical protein AUJ09_01735 [Firmicutes bacterium 13_1_40CM_3_65_11]|nr:MAG: hypothetical protein AUJ09_01735 [Firmicutes bacterium 13_1_40CM_3_65_11]